MQNHAEETQKAAQAQRKSGRRQVFLCYRIRLTGL